MSLLPKERTPKIRDISNTTMLIYGPPKIGKSTFASKFPDALFLPTEPGLNHLEVFQAPADGTGIGSWSQLLEILAEVSSAINGGEFPFKTIVMDTIDAAYSMCVDHVCAELKINSPGDLAHGRAWGIINNEIKRVLTKLAKLPVGLILTSHAEEKELTERGVKRNKTVPTTTGSCRKLVNALVDMILLVDNVYIYDDAGQVTGEKRVIKTKGNASFDAGDRTGKLPEQIDLDFDEFYSAYLAATEEN